MAGAAKRGHKSIVRLCLEWGASNFNRTMVEAADGGHEAIVRLCLEWGASEVDESGQESGVWGYRAAMSGASGVASRRDDYSEVDRAVKGARVSYP